MKESGTGPKKESSERVVIPVPTAYAVALGKGLSDRYADRLSTINNAVSQLTVGHSPDPLDEHVETIEMMQSKTDSLNTFLTNLQTKETTITGFNMPGGFTFGAPLSEPFVLPEETIIEKRGNFTMEALKISLQDKLGNDLLVFFWASMGLHPERTPPNLAEQIVETARNIQNDLQEIYNAETITIINKPGEKTTMVMKPKPTPEL